MCHENELFAIVMEAVPGGELFHRMVEEYENETMPLKKAKLIFKLNGNNLSTIFPHL